ncbi:FG-GAP repeat domain-containing protein [Streptosporangium sp. NPDC002607]
MTAVLLTASVILTLLPSPASAATAPSAPDFGPVIDGYAAFQGQSTCDPTAKPGVVAVRDMLRATYGRADSGIVRACGVGGASEHKEGRALDFPFNANDVGQRAQADGLVAWLLATDRHGHAHALARRLGVMYIIWNRRIWMANSATWSSYSGPSPHTDHVHLSFGWPGALKQTTWWTSSIRPVDRTVGDVTGDGYADLTTVTAQGQLAVYGNVKLMPGSGGKPFQGVSWQTDNTNWNQVARSISTADVTGDGYADLVALTTDGRLQIYANGSRLSGGDFFGGVYREYLNWGGFTNIAAGDINHDGFADLAATTTSGQLHIYLNTRESGAQALPFRNLTWSYPANWGSDVIDIAIGDVTGDAYGDLVSIRTDGTLAVFGNGILQPGNGGRPFVNTTWSVRGGWGGVADVTVSDVTGDGYADLTAVTNGGELQVYGNISGYPPHAPYGGAQWTYPNWGGVRHIA